MDPELINCMILHIHVEKIIIILSHAIQTRTSVSSRYGSKKKILIKNKQGQTLFLAPHKHCWLSTAGGSAALLISSHASFIILTETDFWLENISNPGFKPRSFRPNFKASFTDASDHSAIQLKGADLIYICYFFLKHPTTNCYLTSCIRWGFAFCGNISFLGQHEVRL